MEEFDSPGVLQLKLLIGLAGTLACALAIIHMLFKIELNHDSILHNKKKGKLSPEIEANLSELTLNTTEDSGEYDGTFAAIPDANLKQTVDAMDDANNNASIVTLQKSVSRDGSIGGSEYAKSVGSGSGGSPKNKKIDPLAPSMDIYRRKRLHQETKVGVIFNVSLLTLTSYLLLVFLPSGILLSLIAMTLLSGIILRTQVVEDLRRSRLDRISAIFTLILFMATFLNLATYAGIGKKEGGVYEGPARIVGYDVDNYDNEGSNNNTLRTDLEVEWGGGWGCPYDPTKSCRTSVQGALCAVSEDRKRRMNHIQSLRLLDQEEPDVNADDDEAVDDGGFYGYDVLAEVEVVEEVIEEEMSEENAEIEYEEEEEAVEQIIDQYYKEDTTEVDEAIDIAYEEEDEVFDIVDMEEEDVEETFEDIEDITEEDNKMDTTNVTAQIEELKKQIAELEKDAEVLAEDNYDLEYVAESTEETAAYYQVVDAIDEAELDAAIDVIEDLDETNKYYAAVVQEDEAENEVLEEENEFLEEETDNLKDTVNDVVEYYQGKEKHEDMKKHDKGKGGSSSAGAGAKAKNNGTKVEVEDVVVYYKTETANGTVEEGYYVIMEEETEEGEVLYGYSSETTTGEELEDIAESIYSSVQDAFSFEDDTFEDEYWNYEWGNVWGEYACNDLFDADLENIEYNADEAPGSDDWPYVNIYGSCNSCKAFIVDYYSEEHFDNIRRYQRHAGKYAIFGTLSLLITLALGFMQRLSPSEENEINLLMDQGGLMV